MRRLAAAATVLLALTGPLAAQRPLALPQAALFGAWVGGIVPPPVTLSAPECLAQPIVIFTRDSVLRASMSSTAYAQRMIDSVTATATGFEIRLSSVQGPGDASFGCANPNVLPVQRRGNDEIAFPGCTEFPFPLIRCATR
jgi:hypothetical protein